MALDLDAIKALFAKLAGRYGDDIVGGVAKYGDDVLEGATNYGDDVIRLASNYGDIGDDILKANAHDTYTQATKYGMSPKTTNWIGGVRTSNPNWYHPDVPQTYKYKKIIYEPDGNIINPKQGLNKVFSDNNPIPAVRVPNLSTDDLVTDTFEIPASDWKSYNPIEDANLRVKSLRPHSNTALGRWFRQQLAKKV
jgi:hypothetical protein